MSDNKPIGPFTLTRPRILLLALGAFAIFLITGAIMGGVANYDELKKVGKAAQPSVEDVSTR